MKYFKEVDVRVDFSSIKYENSKPLGYIKTACMHYKENGQSKTWDIVESLDSVCIALFDVSKQAFVLVRQFRPAVFHTRQDGYTYEFCAGLADKEGKSLEVMAVEEVLEECGYAIKPEDLRFIGSFLNAAGMSGSMQYLYYAEVGDYCRVHEGGGIDDECIEVLYLPLEESLDFIFDSKIQKSTSLFAGIHWYHYSYKSGEK